MVKDYTNVSRGDTKYEDNRNGMKIELTEDQFLSALDIGCNPCIMTFHEDPLLCRAIPASISIEDARTWLETTKTQSLEFFCSKYNQFITIPKGTHSISFNDSDKIHFKI